ncbi:MAG: hypothetical protein GX601_07500 [Anaerolineales bacterium]|nr:hypothetical protein [Anaerolineales bacterium]
MKHARGEEPRCSRVWVIGLDGGTFTVLDVFAQRGWMPHLAGLMQEGCTLSLASTIPHITAPAWSSFLTGCNPGRHGVYGFRAPLRGGWERAILNGAAIRAPRVWQYLNVLGLSTGLVNVPMTYPVQPLNGYLVGGMMSPEWNRAVAYPEEVQTMLRAQQYIVDLHVGRRERQMDTREQIAALADDLIVSEQRRVQAALQLVKERPTDFLSVVFVALDRIQHVGWHQIARLIEDPESARSDDVCRRVLAVYQEVDTALGALLAARPEGTAVLVVSDHGFSRLHTRVHLNEWLAQQGWIKFDRAARSARQVARQKRAWLKRLVPRQLLLWGRRVLAESHTVQWADTLAYTGDASENAVFLNVAGREPQGVVTEAEYAGMRARLADALVDLRDPRTGARVMKRVYPRENAYAGPCIPLAPDIVFEPEEGYEITPDVGPDGVIFADAHSEGKGSHARAGILIAAGHGVPHTLDRGRADMADIAPTAMYLLGCPVPSEMDGHPVTAIIEPEWLTARPPSSEPLADLVQPTQPLDNPSYSTDEQKMVEERLSDLGYFE